MPTLHFGFGALEGEFWRLVFVMTRVGAMLVAAPLVGTVGVPAQARVCLAGGVAVLVCAWTPVAPPADLLSLGGMVAVAGEVLAGVTLGFTLQLAMAAPLIGAEIVGGAMAMSMASSVDPASGVQSPALGQYYSVVTTLVFLALGAHLRMFALLVESYRAFPPGETWIGAERAAAVASFAGTMFATAVLIALPAALVLLVVQVVTGVLSRSAPALNLFALGLPAGVIAGLLALIASSSVLVAQAQALVAAALAAMTGIAAP